MRIQFLAWRCAHCDKRMSYHRNYFMIRDTLWRRVYKALRVKVLDYICIACTEKGLGRPLRQRDFTECLVNAGHFGFDLARFPP